MNGKGFSPALAEALDRFTVPPLPAGFADRALERARAPRTGSRMGPEAVAAGARGFARRKSLGNPWRRAGRLVTLVVAASALSATAAAMGWFGQDIRVPVVSTVLEKLALAPAHAAPQAKHGAPRRDDAEEARAPIDPRAARFAAGNGETRDLTPLQRARIAKARKALNNDLRSRKPLLAASKKRLARAQHTQQAQRKLLARTALRDLSKQGAKQVLRKKALRAKAAGALAAKRDSVAAKGARDAVKTGLADGASAAPKRAKLAERIEQRRDNLSSAATQEKLSSKPLVAASAPLAAKKADVRERLVEAGLPTTKPPVPDARKRRAAPPDPAAVRARLREAGRKAGPARRTDSARKQRLRDLRKRRRN